MSDFDAISVGGGLAGAAFALELARHGMRVLVIERSRTAALKVCGDFLSREALDLLGYLGVDTGRLGAVAVDRFTLATAGSSATARLPFPAAGLSRLALDESLLDVAAAAGAEIMRGVTVSGLEPDGRGAVVRTAPASFRARSVALATGKHNLRGCPRPSGPVTAFKLQLSLSRAAQEDLARRVQLVLCRGGYAGTCMVENDLATLCWQIETRRLSRAGSDWKAQLAPFTSQSSLLGDLLQGARAASPRLAAISSLPFGYVRRIAVADGVFPVGDQLAVIPAFTGDGTSLALASGIGAARAVLAGETAAAFQRKFIAGLKWQFHCARTVSLAFRTAPARRLSVATVGIFPSIIAMVARATRLAAPSPDGIASL